MDSADAHRGRVRLETGQKRVRALLGGEVVADTSQPLLVWEGPFYPTYYFPRAAVLADLVPTDAVVHSPSRGEGHVFDVRVGETVAAGAATINVDSPIEELRDAVRLQWDAMDEWLEEDEIVYVHARNPYTRVDILGSTRHVEVFIDGVRVADSHQPRILFETGLPPRYYLPLTDLRIDLLRPSSSESHCPYKGTATYWSIEVNGKVYEDYVWIYRTPLAESAKIAGLACFYNERVDLRIDGVDVERPLTHFS